jgi:lysophosphatidylcholine acyltransferase/lyso-PAF acetyltransferase
MIGLTLGQLILIGVVVAWTLCAVVFVNCIFPRRLKYLAKPEVQESPVFPAFARNDFKRWNYFEMTIVGVFLLPFRFVGTIFCILLAYIVVLVLTLFFCVRDFEKPLNGCFRFLANLTIASCARVILWLMGFTCTSNVKVKYRGQNPQLVEVPDSRTPVCVSNHVSFVDIFYFLSHRKCGFLAKAGVKSAPCVGLLAQAVQCLFVERQNPNARAAMLGKLSGRVEMAETGHNFNSLIIFPEGTTTNNKGLIDFKKGAFMALKPVRVFAVKYRSSFSPQLNMISTLYLFIGMCLQLRNSLTVFEFEHPLGPVPSSTPEEFAENVKLLMCDEFGFENFHNTFEQKIEFESAHMPISKDEYN